MIRAWRWPLVLGLILAIGTFAVTIRQTPKVLMAAAYKRLARGGANAFLHAPLATSKSRAIVRPSPDLAYSSCAIDLSQGPVLITVAAMPASYWSLSVFDDRTDVAFVRNNRETADQSMQLVVAGPGQQLPPGVPGASVRGTKAIALIRVLVDDRARFPAIDRARRTSECRLLQG